MKRLKKEDMNFSCKTGGKRKTSCGETDALAAHSKKRLLHTFEKLSDKGEGGSQMDWSRYFQKKRSLVRNTFR